MVTSPTATNRFSTLRSINVEKVKTNFLHLIKRIRSIFLEEQSTEHSTSKTIDTSTLFLIDFSFVFNFSFFSLRINEYLVFTTILVRFWRFESSNQFNRWKIYIVDSFVAFSFSSSMKKTKIFKLVFDEDFLCYISMGEKWNPLTFLDFYLFFTNDDE